MAMTHNWTLQKSSIYQWSEAVKMMKIVLLVLTIGALTDASHAQDLTELTQLANENQVSILNSLILLDVYLC